MFQHVIFERDRYLEYKCRNKLQHVSFNNFPFLRIPRCSETKLFWLNLLELIESETKSLFVLILNRLFLNRDESYY